jgi:hypothetical protein
VCFYLLKNKKWAKYLAVKKKRYIFAVAFADMAQLVEQRIRNA